MPIILVVGHEMYKCKTSYADSWLGEVDRLYVGDREYFSKVWSHDEMNGLVSQDG